VALVVLALSFSCRGVGLAGEAPGDNVDFSMVFIKVGFGNVAEALGVGEVVAQDALAELVPLAPGEGLPAHPVGG